MKTIWVILITASIVGVFIGSSTYYFVNKKAQQEKASLQNQISSLNKQIPPKAPVYTNAIIPVNPDTNWKTGITNSFIFSYPSNYKLLNTSTVGIAEVPSFLYLESSGTEPCNDLPSKSNVRDIAILPNMLLHYFSDNNSYFASDTTSTASDFKQGVICNYDNTESMTFQYYVSKEQGALSSLSSLKMISTPWSLGTQASGI